MVTEYFDNNGYVGVKDTPVPDETTVRIYGQEHLRTGVFALLALLALGLMGVFGVLAFRKKKK